MPKAARATSQADHLRSLLTLILCVGALYLGRPVILPLALSVLLAFILTPLVVAVQRRGLRRIPAVLVVLGFTLLLAIGVGYGVGTQLSKLAEQAPEYVRGANVKINRLRTTGAGPFSKAIAAFQGVGEAEKPRPAHTPTTQTVVVTQQQTSSLDNLATVATAVLEPLADAALIFILVAFMLIRREDLRNRIIGLLGHGRLTGTTRVIVESAERISRLLLMQLCVNTGFGIVFGLMLFAFGVPFWFLWGAMTVLLRFVPYVGTWLAALLPILLSFAVSPGWKEPAEIFFCFGTLDLVTGNVVEPLLFGHSTGVTPVALLIAAIFWTWVWGPLGLVLSTPLTVCLVVLGQHVPTLRFLSLLMGDEAALEPHVAYYQRLLAGDQHEAMLIARQFASGTNADQLPDQVVVPALRMARNDRKHSGLDAADEAFIFDATESVIKALTESLAPKDANTLSKPCVIGCSAHHRTEELILQLLSFNLSPVCEMEILSTRLLPVEIEAAVEREKPAMVFIGILPPGGVSQARHLCRRLRKRFADLKIVVGYFGKVRDYDQLLTTMRAAGASYVSTSVTQSRNQIQSLLPTEPPAAVVEVGAVLTTG
jgi:predicted PurR-regulated permease PerM